MFELKNNIPAVLGIIEEEAPQIVTQTTHGIIEGAAERAPVDTGALAVSFYVATPGDESAYDDAVSRMRDKNPKIVPEPALRLDDYSDEGVYHAAATSAAPYAAARENGFGSVAGVPALEEAGNEGKADFRARLDKLGKKLGS